MKRSMRQPTDGLPDPRLWDHEPLRSLRWHDRLIVNLPPESELERDFEFAHGRDIGFTYLPDDSKLLRAGTREARIPSRAAILALMGQPVPA